VHNNTCLHDPRPTSAVQPPAFARYHDAVLSTVAPGGAKGIMSDQQSIRPFLASLEKDDALLRVPKDVDPAFELSAFLSAADAGPALLFEKVKGSALRVAGNLLNSRTRIAAALGITPADIVPRIHEAIRGPVKPVQVAIGRAQDVVVTENP